jgi:hypothetical protein
MRSHSLRSLSVLGASLSNGESTPINHRLYLDFRKVLGVMRILLKLVSTIAILAVTIVIMTFDNIVMANAQELPSQPAMVQEKDSTFQSISDGFSVVVPQDWVIQDVSSGDTTTLLAEIFDEYRILSLLCPQQQAVSDSGSPYNCEEAQDRVQIHEYPTLPDEIRSASFANNSLTNEQFLKYQIQKLQDFGYSDINIVNNTDTTINVTSADTNETTAMVPAKLLEMIYTVNSTETRGYFLLSATNATSNLGLISGYSISYEGAAPKTPSGNASFPIRQIFQSFEFVKEGGGGGTQQTEEPATGGASSGEDAAATMNRTTQRGTITLLSSVALLDQTAHADGSIATSSMDDEIN